MSTNVHYTAFRAANMVKTKANKQQFTKPDEKNPVKMNPVTGEPEIGPDGKPVQNLQTIMFWKIPFSCKMPILDDDGNQMKGSDGKPLYTISDLQIEGPEVTCRGGIQTQTRNGKTQHTMYWSYDLTKPEYKAWCGRDVPLREIFKHLPDDESEIDKYLAEAETRLSCMERVQLAAIRMVANTSDEHGLKGYLDQIASSISRPITWKNAEDAKGNPIPGKSPQHYANLVYGGRGYSAVKTLFTLPGYDPKGPNPLDWDADPKIDSLMRGVTVKMIPVWRFSHVTVLANQKASIHMELVSAVVTDIEKLSIVTSQEAKLKELSADTALVSKLHEQIARLQMENRALSDATSSKLPSGPAIASTAGAAGGAAHSASGGAGTDDSYTEKRSFGLTTPARSAGDSLPPLPSASSLAGMLGSGPVIGRSAASGSPAMRDLPGISSFTS